MGFDATAPPIPPQPMIRRESQTGRSGDGKGGGKAIQFLIELGITTVGYYALYLATKQLIVMMDPTRRNKPTLQKVGAYEYHYRELLH